MLVQVVADSALFTTEPATLVLSAILPDKAALTMALVLLELTLILLAIRPDKVSKAMHFIVEPLAGVALFIAPNVDALALDLVHLKLTLVD